MSQDPHHEWWVDLIEGEMDDSLREDLTRFLRNSSIKRNQLEEIKRLRQWIKDSDDVHLPEDGHVYQRMHDRIMAAVDGKRPDSSSLRRGRLPRRSKKTSPRQLGFPALFGAPSLMALIAGVTWMTGGQTTPPKREPPSTSARLSHEEKERRNRTARRSPLPKPISAPDDGVGE